MCYCLLNEAMDVPEVMSAGRAFHYEMVYGGKMNFEVHVLY